MHDTYFVDTTQDKAEDRVRQLDKMAKDELPLEELAAGENDDEDDSDDDDGNDAAKHGASKPSVEDATEDQDQSTKAAPKPSPEDEIHELVATSSHLKQSFSILPSKVQLTARAVHRFANGGMC